MPTGISQLSAGHASASMRNHPAGILIDPHASVEEAHAILEGVEAALTREGPEDDSEPRAYHELTDLRTKLTLPTYLQ